MSVAPRGASNPRGRTVAPSRQRRKLPATTLAIQVERRRTPREIREERHDACAKAICAGTFAERRQGRSPDELHTRQNELQRQWELRQQPKRTPKKPTLARLAHGNRHDSRLGPFARRFLGTREPNLAMVLGAGLRERFRRSSSPAVSRWSKYGGTTSRKRFEGASSLTQSENAAAWLNGTSKAGSSSVTGSAHLSASITAPSVLPTTYMKPGSKWSKRMPSMLEVGGFCKILMRNTGSQAALMRRGAMLIPLISKYCVRN